MPELPEVETIRHRLSELLIGKQIFQVIVRKNKSFRGDPSTVLGLRIGAIQRKSKLLQFDLLSETAHQGEVALHLLVHLKMTGQLIYDDGARRTGGGHPTKDFIRSLPSSHTRVVVVFSDSTHLFFNDMRIFGWMKLVQPVDLELEYGGLAPDITDPVLTVHTFVERARRRSVSIKQLIMDNSVVAGVGNIYACDALNRARIDPRRPANSLSPEELSELFFAMREVVLLGIECGGATVSSYVTAEGLSGTYQHVRRVYKRAGEGCPNCPGIIEKVQLAGRGTFFCPQCQR